MEVSGTKPALHPSRPSARGDALWIIGLAGIYFIAALLSLSFEYREGIAVVCIPSGIFLPAFLRTRKDLRPYLTLALGLADVVAERVSGAPWVVSAIYALAMTSDAVIGATLLEYFVGDVVRFNRARTVGLWLMLSVVLGNCLASTLAAVGASLTTEGASFWINWVRWAASDGVGNLLVTPLVLSWAPWIRHRRGSFSRKVEGVALTGLMCALVVGLFTAFVDQSHFAVLLPYVLLPFLTWAALRFETIGVSTALVVFAAIAVPLTATGLVPSFSSDAGPLDDVIVLQLLLAITAVPALLLAAVVAERRQAEAARLDSQAMFSLTFQSSPIAMSLVSTDDGRFVDVNEAFLAVSGWPRSEVIGRTTADLGFYEDRADRDRLVDQAMKTGRVEGMPCAFVMKSGARRDALVSTSLIVLHGRRYLLSTMQDVSSLRETEASLRQSEFFFKESQRVAHIGSYRVDFVAGVWVSSEVLDEIFGIGPLDDRSIAGWLALIHPDDQARMAGYLQDSVIGRRQQFDMEYRIVRRNDGVTRWVYGLGALAFDHAGAAVSMTGTIQDITERKRVEFALRDSEARLRDLTFSLGEWVWELDADGRYTFSSSKGDDLFGDVIGRSPFEFMAPDETERMGAIFRDLVARKAPIIDLENWNIDRHGRRRCLLTSGVPILRDDGAFLGYRGVDKDITELKRAEQERAVLENHLGHSQKMESVGRLAGGVAHDFNNMLGVILGHAEMAADLPNLPNELHEHLQAIRGAAARSASLTGQLLAFARKQTVLPKVLNLNDVVAGTLKMLQRLIGEDIELRWTPGDATWPVRVDASQMDQILANLAVNARDAIGGVGTVTIATTHRTLTAAECAGHPDRVPGDYVVLIVSDDGSGMSPDTLTHLFEPFFTTKPVGEGTGLGLATVYGAVRQNGGFITVASEPARGTTFAIHLPRHHGALEQERGATVARRQPGRETILVVEDEPGLLKMITQILEGLGYRVIPADTPELALRIAAESAEPIHLLLTDVVMPGMNGRVLADTLMARDQKLKRLFMSGYTADVIANRGVMDDGVPIVQKPFSTADLAARVREVLDAS